MAVDYEEGRRLKQFAEEEETGSTYRAYVRWLITNAEALLNPVSAAPSPAPDEVEAVARAICAHEYGDPDGFAAITLADTERTTPRWHYCKSSARAAIAAMRPTNQEPRNDTRRRETNHAACHE